GRAQDLTVRYDKLADTGDLTISGGPTEHLEIVVEVPKVSGLFVRMPFGELTLDGITGDKDVELHAGELNVSVGNAADYAHVDASVLSGDIDADPFGESHGGLFRSFAKSGSGKFKLHVHVGAGELSLH